MIGYIKLHRQLLDSPSFKNVHEQMAFAWLLLRAQWHDVDVRYKGIRLSLKRGQLALSYRDFAKEWGWSEAKCRRYVTRLQSDAVVSAASDAGVCIITILNYNKFQDSEQKSDALHDAPLNHKVTHQRRTSDAQNKEDNNIINKDIKDISKDIPKKSPVKKGCRIDGKFKHGDQIPDDYLEAALKKGLTRERANSEFEGFVNYWTGASGGNAIKRDWLATWRNRVASSIERSGNNNGNRNGQSKPVVNPYLVAAAKIIDDDLNV